MNWIIEQHRKAAREWLGMPLSDEEADIAAAFLGRRIWNKILGEQPQS